MEITLLGHLLCQSCPTFSKVHNYFVNFHPVHIYRLSDMHLIKRNLFLGIFCIKVWKTFLHRELFHLCRYESLHLLKKQSFGIAEFKRVQFPFMLSQKRVPQHKSKLSYVPRRQEWLLTLSLQTLWQRSCLNIFSGLGQSHPGGQSHPRWQYCNTYCMSAAPNFNLRMKDYDQ